MEDPQGVWVFAPPPARRLAPHTVRNMDVALLYFDGCPSWHETDDRLRQALEATGHTDTTIRYVLVSTPEEAETMQFRGSPTVLVDGKDPFAQPGMAVGLTCRLYPTEGGGPAGSPTLDQLMDALSR